MDLFTIFMSFTCLSDLSHLDRLGLNEKSLFEHKTGSASFASSARLQEAGAFSTGNGLQSKIGSAIKISWTIYLRSSISLSFDRTIGVWTLPRNLNEFYLEFGIRSKTYEAGTQMTDRVRILLIDDDEEDFLIVSDMLAERKLPGSVWIGFRHMRQGLEAISRREHDVYLLDYLIGAHNGLDLLKKAVARGCKAPIIFLTAHGNYAVDLKVMEAGASDYLVKGEFTAPVLERSIRYSMMGKHIEEELKQHRSNLEELVRKRTIQHAEARADAERRANEAEGRQAILEALLEYIPEGIAVVDSPDLQVQALSRYALDMVGLSGGKRRKEPLTDLDLALADLA